MKLSRVGIDLAKNIYQLHGVDRSGKTVLEAPPEASSVAQSSCWIIRIQVVRLAWKPVLVPITGPGSCSYEATPSS